MSYPVSRIFGLTLSRKAPKYLTREEVHRVLSYVKRARDWMIIDFLWNTGVRVSELNQVRLSDINSYAGVVKVRSLKKRREIERSVPVPKDFINRVEKYAQEAKIGPVDRLFPLSRRDIYYLVSKYCKKAGLDSKRRHPHVFRHSFAINCVLQGISGSVLAEWLGHEGLATVMIYARAMAKDTKHLRDGLEF
jgi:integrase/recombinase XerD